MKNCLPKARISGNEISLSDGNSMIYDVTFPEFNMNNISALLAI